VFENFKLETTTIWSFPERGKWATHGSTATYRGNFAPQVARNLILRYSKKGEVVLDPFVGSGTTLVECKILGRQGIGVDINPIAVELCKNNLNFKVKEEVLQVARVGDARHLDFVSDESVDLVIVHPPYADAIRYSNNLDNDLSQIHDIEAFIKEMETVAAELFRVLKPNRCCAILIGDLRRNRRVVPLGFKVFSTFLDVGFVSKEIIIKVQHNCQSTDYWMEKSIKNGFLLLAHEYLLVFEKLGPTSLG
jgi:DNA modification methylase